MPGPMQGPASTSRDRQRRMGTQGRRQIVSASGLRPAGASGSHKADRGQALVEFALVAPVMVLIFASLVQFALIFERQIGIENAVRDGARRGATYETVDTSDADTNGPFIWNMVFGSGGLMLTNVQGYDSGAVPPQSASVCYETQPDANGVTGVFVKVSVGYSHPLFLPIISQILDPLDGTPDNALRIDTSSTFEVQNDPTVSYSVAGCYRL
jgi:Flp pilus assembly protein TadG